MGNQLLDQYSLLHFATGVVAYFWNIGFITWAFFHGAFELIENTPQGMKFINKNLTWWPGGKPKADAWINIIGDNLSAIAGWYCAERLDEMGKRRGWYI